MPSDRSSVLAVIALLGASSAIVVALAGSMQPSSASNDVTLVLTRLVESRSMEVVKPAADEDVFVMSSDEPALTLTFAATLPAGTHIMSLEQPKAVTALDSVGTDLAKIKPGWGDELEYIELEHDFKDDDNVSEITLKLLPAARKADSFSVQANFAALVFTGSKPVAIEGKPEWTVLADDAVADIGKPVRFRVKEEGIEIEPSTIEDWIEKIEIQVAPDQIAEGNGWFSDGSTITYLFDEIPAARPVKATITLRTGVQTIPLTIDVKNQSLP